MPDAQEIITLMKEPSENGKALIEKAFLFSQKAHEGQHRFTGDPYFIHAFATGKNLAIFGADAETIAAGLLHDVIEDAGTDDKEIEKEFGKTVLFLVTGVTKLGKLKYRGLERHVESLRKLFIATAEDPRVILIKLADRLHNVETLQGHTNPEKQHRIALETIEIFAPLANRLGMGKLRGDLEDCAFPYAYPKGYAETMRLRNEKSKLSEKYVKKVHHTLGKKLAEQGFTDFHIGYRIKGLYSLYRKLRYHDMDIDKIHDIVALRVIVPSVGDCYRVLGIVHNIWRPLPGRIKDYIATPKYNGYQSLHTTVFTGDGGITEIQIRTREMHQTAEYGIASHLAYKEGILSLLKRHVGIRTNKKLSWIRDLIAHEKDMTDDDGYLKNLKLDFFGDRVFVFTPKGDVIDLPACATAIDFAYAIHSDVGNHIAGVKINGKFVAIDTVLKNGDIIEVLTRRDAHPSKKWLEYSHTTIARKHIKAAIQKTFTNPITRFRSKNS